MARRLAALGCGALLLTATPALAQMQWADRAFVNISAGIQTGVPDVTSVQAFTLYEEEGSLTSSLDLKNGLLLDGQVGYRLTRNLAVGAVLTFIQGKSDAEILGSIPDPVFFSSPRAASASATGLTRREIWFAPTAVWMVPITDRIQVSVSGGPAVVQLAQELPTAVAVAEPGPTLSDATVTSLTGTGFGFVVGADARYMVTDRFGLGALARFASAAVDLGNDTDVDVGGFQFAGGLRIRF